MKSFTFVSFCGLIFALFSQFSQADIYQWEYINVSDPSQGKRQSTTLAPDGAGVDAAPGADLRRRNLTMAYLAGADLSDANLSASGSPFPVPTILMDADLSHANLMKARFVGATLTGADFTGAGVRGTDFHRGRAGTGITLAQLYSTASYQDRNLAGIGLSRHDSAGGNFAGQNLTNAKFDSSTLTGADFREAALINANFNYSTLTDADFTGADVTGTYFHAAQGGTGITLEQLYSTASYQAHDLAGIFMLNNDLTGWNFAGQYLANAWFHGATLTGADLTGADVRGAQQLNLSGAAITNLILADGRVSGLDLSAGEVLFVRDYDGDSRYEPALPPIPITIDQHMTMGPGGTLRMVFEADAWDSTISFAPGIPVALGGTLELTFADDVNLASQLGRTFDLFDWTGVAPTGNFDISSPYAWDLSNLYATGEVTLTAVPEPDALLMFCVSVAAAFPMSRTASNRNQSSLAS